MRPLPPSNQCSASPVGCSFGLICACLSGVWYCESPWVIEWTAERCLLHAGMRANIWEIRKQP